MLSPAEPRSAVRQHILSRAREFNHRERCLAAVARDIDGRKLKPRPNGGTRADRQLRKQGGVPIMESCISEASEETDA